MSQRILKLKVQNVKGVQDAEVVPGENVLVIIGGRNGQGKSSVLDSIVYALAGKRSMPGKPVRKGTDKAEIVLELDELIVTRVITENTDRLEVKTREGAKYPSPQAMLDKLVGRLSFDPLAFSRLGLTANGRREQSQLVMELAGLDFSELDARRVVVFEERTGLNRESKRLEAQCDGMPTFADAPAEEISIGELTKKLRDARAANQKVDYAIENRQDLEQTQENAERTISQVKRQIEELKQTLTANEKDLRDITELIKEANKELSQMKRIDEGAIEAELSAAEGINQKVRANRAQAEKMLECGNVLSELETKTSEITALDEEKAELIQKAKLPVDGLGFDAEGLILNGIPLAQAAASEQLRMSVSMGMASNPELRIMLIDQGSELDGDNLKILAAIAKEKDAQIWMCRVSEGDECLVIMEAGKVRDTAKP